MRNEAWETFEVGDVKVEIFHDEDAFAPGDNYDEIMMLVGWAREFSNKVKGYDSLEDFGDFVHPHKLNEYDYPNVVTAAEPTVMPERRDAVWMQVYADAADEIEQLVLEGGGEVTPSNIEAIRAAEADFDVRREVWECWQTYRKAHAEYACFVVDVRYYGGGHTNLRLGDVWDGDISDRNRDPEAVIRLKRADFTHSTPQAVAESMVAEWNQYMEGDVYGYVLTRTDTGEELDSCWGYYGIEYCRETAKETAEYYDKKMVKQMVLPFTQKGSEANG